MSVPLVCPQLWVLVVVSQEKEHAVSSLLQAPEPAQGPGCGYGRNDQ